MPFKKAQSWKERGLQLQVIKDECNEILNRLHLPRDDARAQGIIHVRQLCNTLAAVTFKLQQNAEIRGNIPSILALLGLPDENSLRILFSDLNSNSKAAFLTMVQFALENCIAQVINAIGTEQPSGKFSQDANLIIKLCSLPEPERKHELLLVPALLRNTLHANGIYKWPSKAVIIETTQFVFEKDKRIKCASWSHIMHAILHSLSVYEEILMSQKVHSIQQVPAR